ncbi:MAG TPA: metalloregulator ArsR/SmtB family transcription factor [Rhodanobacteraceae bacterium]|nr:metalloregulator ArsR/SmtB family transcription factor [Rhodanobacteraceae bacterium]
MDLAATSALLRLLSDPTRVRLLGLLQREELTVAELSAVLRLAQPRVSTHLAKLKEAGLVHDRRAGVSAYYRLRADLDDQVDSLLAVLAAGIDDAVLADDLARLPSVLAGRAREQGWADTVAGDMERHYSPGRTWETLARALLQLLDSGDVLDIASGDGILGELLAPHARSVVCVDFSERVVNAARVRLASFANVEVVQGDMHALELGERRFDLVLMMHALTYSERPAQAVSEARRMLRPGGRLLAVTLARHAHRAVVEPFDHRNLGFRRSELTQLAQKAGLEVLQCQRVSRERRPPHFEILSLLARAPTR